MQIQSRSMVIMISAVISLSHHTLWLLKCAMKCINTLRNWVKLQPMPQSFSLMFPLQHYADGVELHQLHQSQSWNLLKVQLSVQLYFITDVEETCEPCFWLVFPAGCLIFPCSLNGDKYLKGPMLLFRWLEESWSDMHCMMKTTTANLPSHKQTVININIVAFQSQTSYLIACQSMLIARWSNSGLLL